MLNIVSEGEPGRKTSEFSSGQAEAVRNHLEEILKSSVFSGSRRSQEMLRYVVEQASHGNVALLKERLIGIAVFRRATDYDTASDSTVRVAANEVRKRLAQYYMSDGRDAGVRIDLPSGGYTPRFEFHSTFPETRTAPSKPEPTIATPPAARPRVSRLTVFLAAVAVTALALSLELWAKNRDLTRAAGLDKASPVAGMLPWSAFLESPLRTQIVLADVSVGTIQELTDQPITLQDYIARNFIPHPEILPKETLGLATTMTRRMYTSSADANAVESLLKLDPRLAQKMSVRHSRTVLLEELNATNAIFLGTGYSNLWTQTVDPQLNFHVAYDRVHHRHYYVNGHPKPGEPALFDPAGPTGTTGIAYALVAFIPNSRRDGHDLLLAGTNTEATREATEFITHRDRCGAALRKIGIDPRGPARAFELMLQVHAIGGTSSSSEVIAWRTSN
jgi:hypothetical protein